ncbi:MAG: hypothetical protein ACYCOR_20485 [Acidobacteriaceae bacterium]
MSKKGQFQDPGMSYLLRFVQKYQPSAAQIFFELEAEFKELERRSPKFPQGRRSQLLLEGEPINTLIWESEFNSLNDVQDALKTIADDPAHTSLFEKQRPYIVEMLRHSPGNLHATSSPTCARAQ